MRPILSPSTSTSAPAGNERIVMRRLTQPDENDPRIRQHIQSEQKRILRLLPAEESKFCRGLVIFESNNRIGAWNVWRESRTAESKRGRFDSSIAIPESRNLFVSNMLQPITGSLSLGPMQADGKNQECDRDSIGGMKSVALSSPPEVFKHCSGRAAIFAVGHWNEKRCDESDDCNRDC